MLAGRQIAWLSHSPQLLRSLWHLAIDAIEDVVGEIAAFLDRLNRRDHARMNLRLPRKPEASDDASTKVDQRAVGSRDVRVWIEHALIIRRRSGEYFRSLNCVGPNA